MKSCFLLYLTCLLFLQLCYAQEAKSPNNLEQAVQLLEKETPDSVKILIKNGDNNELSKLIYPASQSGYDYKLIYDWLGDNDPDFYSPGNLNEYLVAHHVTYNEHQQMVVLLAFKENLLGHIIAPKKILKPYVEIEYKWAQEDKMRYTADSLKGFYIPKDLQDCFGKLDQIFNDTTKRRIKTMSEKDFTARYHLGFGTWLRNNWGLWQGSRLSRYFHELGITFAEDMSGIILHSYHRYILGTQIKLAEQVKFYKTYWDNVRKKELEETRSAFEKYEVGDTVTYLYNYRYLSEQQKQDYQKNICSAKAIILQRDEVKFLVKVRLLTTCDPKGIISYDNKGTKEYDKQSQRWVDPKRQIIKTSRSGDILWFYYQNWEPSEKAE